MIVHMCMAGWGEREEKCSDQWHLQEEMGLKL
jgi:hypothetical protein